MHVTRTEFEHVREDISHLKKELLQLRKFFKQQQLEDFPVIKTREVRKMLKVSASTLQTMRNKGQIPYTRLGGLLLYKYGDIRNLLLKGKSNVQ
jgi:5-bromo-4-chloroindolyl phosphate hydrolysis protein